MSPEFADSLDFGRGAFADYGVEGAVDGGDFGVADFGDGSRDRSAAAIVAAWGRSWTEEGCGKGCAGDG